MTLSYYFIITTSAAIELLLCCLFFTFQFKKKPGFILRLLGSLGCFMLCILLFSIFRQHYNNLTTTLCIRIFCYILIYFMLKLCYFENYIELLLAISAGCASQLLTGRIFEFIMFFAGKDPYNSLSLFPDQFLPIWADWAIYTILHIAIAYVLSVIFRRKRVDYYDGPTSRGILFYCLSFTFILVVLSNYSRPIEPEHPALAMIIRCFALLYGLSILFLRSGILEKVRLSNELKATEEILLSEKKQFESMQKEIELINIKCHDIRHRINEYEDKLTSEELKELKNIIQIYDSSIKTGNDILDMLLYREVPLMEQQNIHFSCIADGRILSFMEKNHIYSLFKNALDNAISAVMKLEDPEMRIISLTIANENGFASIHVSNYVSETPTFHNNLPQTTASDNASLHGYGTRSMQYITEYYKGSIHFSVEKNIFYLDILLPIG